MEEMDAGHKRLESFPKVEIPVGWGSHANGGRDVASSSSFGVGQRNWNFQNPLQRYEGGEPNEDFGHGGSQWGEYLLGLPVDRAPPHPDSAIIHYVLPLVVKDDLPGLVHDATA